MGDVGEEKEPLCMALDPPSVYIQIAFGYPRYDTGCIPVFGSE